MVMTRRTRRYVPALLGAAAGALFLLDPDRGRLRRARLRDKAIHASRMIGEAAAETSRDTRNRSKGAAATLKRATRDEAVDDVVLEERVRSALGRVTGHAGAIHVRASGGRVILSGDALTSEADGIVAAVRTVPGVSGVQDDLARHATPGKIPALQGTGRRTEARPDILQRRWAPATRLMAIAAGTGAAVTGLAVRGPLGYLGALIGGSVAVRGLTNLELGRVLGLTGGRQGVNIQKSIEVDAPPEAAYQLWSRFEEFPRFMSHVRSVERRNGGSHWTIRGPAEVPIEFDAEVTRNVPNELLAWKSMDGEPIRHSGIVRFEPRGHNRTRITVRMTYNPPAGLLAHAIASVLGADPKTALDDDLLRFKSLLEQGKASVGGRTTKLEEVMSSV
jgi:uncharacterized membrane protein